MSAFFTRSTKSTCTQSTRRKSSLELFAEAVGDGESAGYYEFPPLEMLEFDAQPFDSLEVLGEPQDASTATFEGPPPTPTDTCPYVFNIDDDAELRAERAIFAGAVGVDAKFVKTLMFDSEAYTSWRAQ